MYNSKLYLTLSYLTSTNIGLISMPAFASLVGILIRIRSSVIGGNICAITSGIKKYNLIIKKKKKKHDKIVLLAKSKSNRIEVLISKALIDWSISHNEFNLINNLLKEYDNLKKEIKILKN